MCRHPDQDLYLCYGLEVVGIFDDEAELERQRARLIDQGFTARHLHVSRPEARRLDMRAPELLGSTDAPWSSGSSPGP